MNNESYNSKVHISYEDLVEYNRGNLSNSEMHRIELHLIDCELCNEALEGVGTLDKYDDASSSIEKIKRSTGTAEAPGLSRYHYIGIAASVIIIAVLGFLFTRTSGVEEPMLVNESAPGGVLDKSTDAQPLEVEPEEDKGEDSLMLATIEIDEGTSQPIENEIEIIASEATPPPPAQGVTSLPDSQVFNETDRIADLVITDTSTINTAQDTTFIAAEMTMEEAENMARSKKMVSPAPSEALMDVESDVAAPVEDQVLIKAEPERGMRAFQRYLRRNLNYPSAANDNNIEGDVELSIVINADGSIGEITVTKSLGFGCDEEAMRLIREGQNWTPGTRGGQPIVDTITIIVHFEP